MQFPLVPVLKRIDLLVLVILVAHQAPDRTLDPNLGATIPTDPFPPPFSRQRAGYGNVFVFSAVLVTAR